MPLPKYYNAFFDAIPNGCKTRKILDGAPHTYCSPEHLQALKEALDIWLRDVVKG